MRPPLLGLVVVLGLGCQRPPVGDADASTSGIDAETSAAEAGPSDGELEEESESSESDATTADTSTTGQVTDTTVSFICGSEQDPEASLDGLAVFFSGPDGEIFEETDLIGGLASCYGCADAFTITLTGLEFASALYDISIAQLPAGQATIIQLCSPLDPAGAGNKPAQPEELPFGDVVFEFPDVTYDDPLRHAYSLTVPGDPYDAYSTGTYLPPMTIYEEVSSPNGGLGHNGEVGAFAVVDSNYPDFLPVASSFARAHQNAGQESTVTLPPWDTSPTVVELTIENSGSLASWGDLYFSHGFSGYPLYVTRFATNTGYTWDNPVSPGESASHSFAVIPPSESTEAYTYVSLGDHATITSFYEARTPLVSAPALDLARAPRPVASLGAPSESAMEISWQVELPTDDSMLQFRGVHEALEFGVQKTWLVITPAVHDGGFSVPHIDGAPPSNWWLQVEAFSAEFRHESWLHWQSRLDGQLRMRVDVGVFPGLAPADEDWVRWATWGHW